MKNFTYYNPVTIHFGTNQIANISKEIPRNKKVLLIYGGGSIKNNGVYDQVLKALAKHNVIEFSGIEPNPQYHTLMQAVELARHSKIQYILAVGGGSVIDGTKFIAAAIPFKGNEWDILSKNAKIKKAIPYGTILTLPGTGSEMNCGAVISRKETSEKLVFHSPKVFPKFSILDPTTTYSLPLNQTCNGIVDAFVHVTEQYLTYPADAPLQDRMAEGILKTLIEEAAKILKDQLDYAARANIMWCSTMALNGLIGVGVPEDWATHLIGHEITALYGIAHGPTLALILPSLLHERREQKKIKLLQYAKNVWGIDTGNENEQIDKAIQLTKKFFQTLGQKTSFRDYDIGQEAIPVILKQLKKHNLIALGEKEDITLEVIESILKGAL